jgi:predicted DNA-binding transcriptional regulator AlpA
LCVTACHRFLRNANLYTVKNKHLLTVEKLVGVEELAEWLGVEVKTVYWLNTTGKGPKRYKIGKLIKYKPSEVEEWIREQAVVDLSAALTRRPPAARSPKCRPDSR